VVTVHWLGDRERGNAAAVELGVGLIPAARPIPALAVSLPASDRAEEALVAAIDRVEGTPVQAFVTRWGSSLGIAETPYELACEVRGQCVFERVWVERWLRGIGPGTLWLGAALRAHAPGAPARQVISDVRATERTLAAILPSVEDWNAGMAEFMRGVRSQLLGRDPTAR
jgi:hypothetical protein